MGLYQWLRGESQFVKSKSKTRKSSPRSSYADAASDYTEARKPVSAKKSKSKSAVYHTATAYHTAEAHKPVSAKKSKTRKNTSLVAFLSSKSVKPATVSDEVKPDSLDLLRKLKEERIKRRIEKKLEKEAQSKKTVHSYVPIQRCPNGQHRNQSKEGRCERISVIAKESKTRKLKKKIDLAKDNARKLQEERLLKRIGSKRQ